MYPSWYAIVAFVQPFEGLNAAQQEAVRTTEGPLLVLAGAGAGKTRVIVERILQIVRGGVAPEHILAITFTNKAAGEMRERVLKRLSPQDRAPFISTFHSLGLLILKENFRALGLKRRPAVYDRADSLRTIKEVLKSLGSGGEIEPRAALSGISRQKGEGVTAGQFSESAHTHRDRFLASLWLAYERALSEDSALDFDDLLLRSEKFLRETPSARDRYQQRWQYIHIDEYQDTNRIQARLAELLVGEGTHLCAVGDIDQTIYSWRGADIANILSFEKKYAGARVITLEENYRSTKHILAAANEVIAKNVHRLEKNLYTNNAEGEALSLYQAFDETDEARFVVREIATRMAEKKARPSDCCVLYRVNFQSRALEEALLAADIPYQVVGTRFFERKEVKDMLAWVRAALFETPSDIVRAAGVPARGIGKVTLLKMLGGREHELSGAVQHKVARFHMLLTAIREKATELSPSKLMRFVLVESGMDRMHKEDKLEGEERLENIRELISLAARYDAESGDPEERLQEFLDSAALASDQDELKDTNDAVRLMTVHASKGLEFSYVFITGLEEGLFPYEREEEGQDAEEERRLMYVALTRARKKVFLSYASYRTVFGSKNGTMPSQFLSDIPQELLQWESPERVAKTIYLE